MWERGHLYKNVPFLMSISPLSWAEFSFVQLEAPWWPKWGRKNLKLDNKPGCTECNFSEVGDILILSFCLFLETLVLSGPGPTDHNTSYDSLSLSQLVLIKERGKLTLVQTVAFLFFKTVFYIALENSVCRAGLTRICKT